MTTQLVGRDHPLGLLVAAIERAVTGRGGVVLVAGEAGIGKTSLMAAAADRATDLGAVVVAGGGWDGDGVPGLWPWIQVVRGLERALPSDEWERCRDLAGPGIGVLVGETGAQAGSVAGEDAFYVFDAVMALLIAVSRARPLVVVLDDLHWADAATLRLLSFVQRQLTLEAIAVVAAYRDVEIEAREHPLRELVHDISAGATTIRLGGLDRDGVRALVAREVSEPDDDAVDELHRRTGGNPFFVGQAVQLWSTTGSARAMAPGVRDALDRRLARLPAAGVDVLSTAALVGTEFEHALVGRACDLDDATLRTRLEPAERAGLIVTIDSVRCRFVHDLVREALVDSLDDEVSSRHAAIVVALDAGAVGSNEGLAVRLAHHAYSALPDLPAERVVPRLVAAAQDATRRCAAEEAALHLSRAMTLVPEGSPEWPHLAIDLGNAQQRAGALEDARLTFAAIATAARSREDWASFAEAALGLHGLGQLLTEHATEALLVEARAHLDDEGPATAALWARVTAALSRTMTHEIGQDRDESERLSELAVERARTVGDDHALAFCLLARHDAVWKPGSTGERLGLTDEMTAAAQRTSDLEVELQASLLRMVALFEQGNPRALDEQRALSALAERARLPRFRYYAQSRQATVSTLVGEFAAAREQADRARDLAEQLGEVDAVSVWSDQRCQISRLQHRSDEFGAVLEQVRAAPDVHMIVLEGLQALLRGDAQAASAIRDQMLELGVQWPRWAALIWLTFEAEIALLLGDEVACRVARAAIEPYADLWAVLGGVVIVNGPLRYWLASLDAALGDRDAAIAGFEAAAATAERMGARPWGTLAAVGLARELLLRNARDDSTPAAAQLLVDADAAATAMGMNGVLSQVVELHANVARERAMFRRDGDAWNLAFAGRSVVMADAKGLRDIHALLTRPGADVAAKQLLDPTAATTNGGGADPVLDDRARAEFRRRLDDLDGQIEEALARHADATVARLEEERDAIVDELRRVTGLGGRPRRLGDDHERARKTVTARIRDVLRKLDERHPELAAHLRDRVTTGSWCRYEPDPAIDWTL